MHENSKALQRRIHDARFATRYFVGAGIDIGGKPDPLAQYSEQFPGMHPCRTWDLEDGDAQFLPGIADASCDFVHSSHCLEHMVDPHVALQNWIRVLKPGGYLVCTVPDEDMYEQGKFPSTFNPDHKWTFTINKARSWSDKSVNIFDLLGNFAADVQILKVEYLDATFRYRLPRFDQTLTPAAECSIEFILRRKTSEEIRLGGRLPAGAMK